MILLFKKSNLVIFIVFFEVDIYITLIDLLTCKIISFFD